MGERGRIGAVAAAAVLAVIALAGCNQNTAGNGPADKALATVETFVKLCAAGHGPDALELLTDLERATFVSGNGPRAGCEKVLRFHFEKEPTDNELKDTFEKTDVTRAEANGGFARVALHTADGRRSIVQAEEIRGRWYIGNSPGLP